MPTQNVATLWGATCFAFVAMCCNMLGVVGSNLKMAKFAPTTPNMPQHIATRWPNVTSNSVAICCVGMLRSFGRGLIETLVQVWESSKKLWKHSPAARVPTVFLVLPNFHWCFFSTNRFHVAVRLFRNRSQMTSKCGKNKKVAHEA